MITRVVLVRILIAWGVIFGLVVSLYVAGVATLKGGSAGKVALANTEDSSSQCSVSHEVVDATEREAAPAHVFAGCAGFLE